MKKWNLPRLSRGQQTALGLLLVPLVCVLLWGKNRFLLSDPCLSLRRAERQNLVGPSDIQAVAENRRGPWAVGVYMNQVLLNEARSVDGLRYWPRTEGAPTLVPLPGSYYSFPDESSEEIVLAAVDLPEGTASARLELYVSCWYCDGPADRVFSARMEDVVSMPESLDSISQEEREALDDVLPQLWERKYNADGELLEEGGCLFRVQCEKPVRDPSSGRASLESLALACVEGWNTYDPHWSVQARRINCRMEAVFSDGNGTELARASLSTPEGGENGGF